MAAASHVSSGGGAARSGGDRPNIVTILTDDQGIWALGCAGNPEIRTPHLDRLAASGIRFDQFFCASPVCSPARASILTGRIPSQHGVHDWLRGGNAIDEAIEYLEGQPGYSDFLDQAGYACGFSGKWHLGASATPQKGYNAYWFTHREGGGPYYNAPVYRDGKPETEPRYITDVITDEALTFLERQAGRGEPFHLAVNYTAPHSPWIDNHPKELVDSYDDCPFTSCPVEPEHPWALRNTVPGGVRDNRREHLKGYFAAVTAMDANVGRLLDTIEQIGMRERTLILFLSDNGYNLGHHGVWGKGNGTFPLNMYEESVKVPAIVSQPGSIPEGVVCSELLSQYDVLPTLLDYLGIENPLADALPGRSFAPVLRGERIESRERVVVYDEYGPVRMVRTREWKYVHRYPYGPHELYDLVNDPGERENRIDDSACGAIRAELKAQLDEWFHRYVIPEFDGTHEAVYGKGQLTWAGPRGRGAQAFADDID